MKSASWLLVSCVAACLLAVGAQARGTSNVPTPDFVIPGTSKTFLSACSKMRDPKRRNCYIRGLLAIVEKSGDPARELPRIDRRVHATGGYLEAWCHIYMHEVGRIWARRHHVTLSTLYHYVPRSNDPGCSAGFGMGLVMYLGGALISKPRTVLPTCTRLPTRFREYTCIHGAGHAFMRGFHGVLRSAVHACRKLGARFAPDCAQGAYHDYWISLSGGDGTTRPRKAVTDPRLLCGRSQYPLPCWYRFFIERRPSARVDGARDLVRLCASLEGIQRSGCIAGASLLMSIGRDPVSHAKTCTELSGDDVLGCLRGVNVPSLVNQEWEQFRLLHTCARLPQSTRFGCYLWFGRTLAVVTDGRFRRTGCPRLGTRLARRACSIGASRMNEPLGTFS